jgi:two-component system, LuxR family, response regulator FixJ
MTREATGTVFIVDDDAAVRDSLTLLLTLRGYMTLCFSDGDAFLAAIDAESRGCVLLDLLMPGKDGLEIQAEMGRRGIALPLIMVTAHGDVATARNALKAGAFDFLEKPIDDALLFKAINEALAIDNEARVKIDQQIDLRGRLARLTPREREVLELVLQGRHNREVAVLLGISSRTVEVYKARLMDKLHVDRLPELIRLVMELDSSAKSSS